jgi:hypothetical protein
MVSVQVIMPLVRGFYLRYINSYVFLGSYVWLFYTVYCVLFLYCVTCTKSCVCSMYVLFISCDLYKVMCVFVINVNTEHVFLPVGLHQRCADSYWEPESPFEPIHPEGSIVPH